MHVVDSMCVCGCLHGCVHGCSEIPSVVNMIEAGAQGLASNLSVFDWPGMGLAWDGKYKLKYLTC